MPDISLDTVEWHVVYTYDGETYAVGPFEARSYAQMWLSGFRAGTNYPEDEVRVLGVLPNLDDIEVDHKEKPVLSTKKVS